MRIGKAYNSVYKIIKLKEIYIEKHTIINTNLTEKCVLFRVS